MRSSWYLIHRFYDHPPLEECQDWWSSEIWDFPGLRVGCMNLRSSVKSPLGKKKCNRKTGRCWIKKNKQKKHCALMDSQGAARRGRGRWHMFSVGRGSHRNVFNGTDKSLLLWLAGPLVNSSRPLFFFFFLAALKMAAGSVPVSSVPFPTLLLSPWWWLQQQPAWQWGLSEAGG